VDIHFTLTSTASILCMQDDSLTTVHVKLAPL